MSFFMLMTKNPQQIGRCKDKPYANYNIKISTKRTEVVYQPAHGNPYNVNYHSNYTETTFTYLTRTLPRAVHIDDAVNTRIAKSVLYLADYIEIGIMLDTKLKVYKLWFCQPSFMHVRPGQSPSARQRNWTASTQAVWENSWSDGKTRSDTKVLKKAMMQNTHTSEADTAMMGWPYHQNLFWTLPQKIFHGELRCTGTGKCLWSGQKTRYSHIHIALLKNLHTLLDSWEQVAHQWVKWCYSLGWEQMVTSKKNLYRRAKCEGRKVWASACTTLSALFVWCVTL